MWTTRNAIFTDWALLTFDFGAKLHKVGSDTLVLLLSQGVHTYAAYDS